MVKGCLIWCLSMALASLPSRHLQFKKWMKISSWSSKYRMPKEKVIKEKSTRGNASQFFIAGELCRRGYSAVVTLGNTPNTDILCSNIDGTKFVHIQVKTFIPGNRTCSVGKKAEKSYGDIFFWILGGIPQPNSEMAFQYFVIPSLVMSKNIKSRTISG